MPRKRGAQPHNRNSTKHRFYTGQPTSDKRAAPTPADGDLANIHVARTVDGAGGPIPAPDCPGNGRLPTLSDLIRDLDHKQQLLAAYIAGLQSRDADPGDIASYIAAMSLYGANAARMSRMIKSIHDVGGSEGEEKLADALTWALNKLEAEHRLGVGPRPDNAPPVRAQVRAA